MTRLLYLILIIASVSQMYSQAAVYEIFDNRVGRNNLGINNGTIHRNQHRSIDQTHRYFQQDKYIASEVVYDGQPYHNVSIKYDILEDVLIAKIDGANNVVGINLIGDKVESFTFNGKKFVNLNNDKSNLFAKGYLEEIFVSPTIQVYTKYRKDRIEVLITEGVFNRYEETVEYLFCYKNSYYRIRSEKDVIAVFKQYKDSIRDFYRTNKAMESADKKLFLTTLMKHLNNLQHN